MPSKKAMELAHSLFNGAGSEIGMAARIDEAVKPLVDRMQAMIEDKVIKVEDLRKALEGWQ